jgi:ABC-type amino acid transport substrate-binding protein
MDYRVSFRATAFSLLFSAVENDLADVAIGELTITEQRKKTVDFTNSYHQSSLALLVSPDNMAQKLDDLKGKSIGVKSRSTGDFYFENLPGYTIRRLSIFPDLAQLLNERVIDGIVFDRPVIEQWLAGRNIAGRIITLEGQEEYAIAYQKKNPDIGMKLNKAIETLAKSGKLDVIIKKWLTPYSEGNTAPS